MGNAPRQHDSISAPASPSLTEEEIASALDSLTPARRKDLLLGMFCAGVIRAEEVSFWFYVYDLQAV